VSDVRVLFELLGFLLRQLAAISFQLSVKIEIKIKTLQFLF
jgi:hypothetical protein